MRGSKSCGSRSCSLEAKRQRAALRKQGGPSVCAICGAPATYLTCGASDCKRAVRIRVKVKRQPKPQPVIPEDPAFAYLNDAAGTPLHQLDWATRNPRLKRGATARFHQRTAKLRTRLAQLS